MSNETSSVDRSAISPAQTQAAPGPARELTSGRQDPGDDGKMEPLERERTSSVSDEYLRYLSKPGHVEKRFPVDRKKLERLIVAGRNDNESAEDFFQSVMETSNTLILWPSKLKIGAKSKKDPQVKVIGLPPNVQRARELILADLDAKSTRVTLKIDVPFAEHSHVIGKEGANIKKVHEETKCHIHFPDSNRSLHSEKSNQVSITGQVAGVELARKRIRELLPVVVTFNLPLPGQIDPNSSDIQQMMLQYNVTIHIKPQPRHYSMLIVVRGTMRFLDGLKLAISKVVEYFTGDYRAIPQVNLNLDMAPQHHRTVIGSGGGNIRKIMEETGTTIQFPDPQSRYQTNQVIVTGTVDGVFRSREQLLGCLPVVLMFDVYDTEDSGLGTDRQTALIGDLMQRWDVYISIKAKQKQPIQSVIIKSIEQNMQCVYEARVRVLEFSNQSIRGDVNFVVGGAGGGAFRGVDQFEQSTEIESSFESSLTASMSTVSDVSNTGNMQSVQLPTSLSEDRLAGKTSFASSETTVSSPKFGITSSGTYTAIGGGEWGGGRREGGGGVSANGESREGGGKVAPLTSPPAITVETTTTHSPSPDPLPTSPPVTTTTTTTLPPPRLTPKVFVDYDRKKQEAQKAKSSKVDSAEPRYPTPVWAGYNFSESMPVRKEPSQPSTQNNTPQGLTSLNKSGFQALMRQASLERAQAQQSEQEVYRGVKDLPTLLQRLDLEKYQSCFDNEEIDLTIFLSLSESDLEGIGVSTLGARRKMKIAISEIKKLQSSGKTASQPGFTQNPLVGMGKPPSSGGFQNLNPHSMGKSGSLKRSGSYSMSQSVRF